MQMPRSESAALLRKPRWVLFYFAGRAGFSAAASGSFLSHDSDLRARHPAEPAVITSAALKESPAAFALQIPAAPEQRAGYCFPLAANTALPAGSGGREGREEREMRETAEREGQRAEMGETEGK